MFTVVYCHGYWQVVNSDNSDSYGNQSGEFDSEEEAQAHADFLN